LVRPFPPGDDLVHKGPAAPPAGTLTLAVGAITAMLWISAVAAARTERNPAMTVDDYVAALPDTQREIATRLLDL